VMLEVPSLLWQLDELMPRVDFVSVGSNDLFQYVMAVDRDNKRVANRFDPLAPPFLRVLHKISRAARHYGTALTLCGEMGGRPLEALALIGLGFRSLSMSASSIGPLKALVLALDVADLAQHVEGWLASHEGAMSLRDKFKDYAAARRLPI